MSIQPKSGYRFKQLLPNKNKCIGASEVLVKTWHFKFRTQHGIRYNVDIEEFIHELFILKFHQDKHADDPNKYRVLTAEGDCLRIFATILNITMKVYAAHPRGSFGFVGAQTMDEQTRATTKRWKVYKRIMAQYFSPEQFKHADDAEKSLFVVLNKQMEAEVPKLWELILVRLEEDYQEYEAAIQGRAFTRST